MPKDLERDLGLYATITISIGAMIGSGIFVLPGLAAKIAGPAVILAASPGSTKMPLPTIAPMLIVMVAYRPRSRSR